MIMNHCTFVGRLTSDPESREVGETSVTNFSLAVEDRYTVRGEEKIEVEYPNFEAWGGLGQIMSQYCKKGDQVIVESKMKKDTWEDKDDGTKRSSVYFKVKNFYFGAKKKGGGE
jgi:single-strand DNA-binding protein